MFALRLIQNFKKYWFIKNMAFLSQLADEYLQKKANNFSVSNFGFSYLFDLINLVNDQIVEIEINFAVTYS